LTLEKGGTLKYETLLFDIRDHVGWLTLNRPDRGNAVSLEMVQELREFFATWRRTWTSA